MCLEMFLMSQIRNLNKLRVFSKNRLRAVFYCHYKASQPGPLMMSILSGG